jgi:hypothetical protein
LLICHTFGTQNEKGHQLDVLKLLKNMVAWDGIEPPTRGFSDGLSSYTGIG